MNTEPSPPPSRYLTKYTPELDPGHWDEIRDFVLRIVSTYASRTAYSEKELVIAVTKFADWAWSEAGLQLDADSLLTRNTVGRFITVGCHGYSPAGRGNVRSRLLRVVELHSPTMNRRLRPLPPSSAARPYDAEDVIRLRLWANTQSTAARVRNATVLVGLGFGAGLSAVEIGNVRVLDINAVDDITVITVTGGNPREVPVVREWAPALTNAVVGVAPELFAFRPQRRTFYTNVISNFVDRGPAAMVRLTTQRMRATWLVHHMMAGTPVADLVYAAGVEGLDAFARYVQFIPRLEEDAYRRVLSR